MGFVLQSTDDPTLYYNGSVLSKRSYFQALFSPIDNARNFDTSEDAKDVADTFEVPVNVVEV